MWRIGIGNLLFFTVIIISFNSCNYNKVSKDIDFSNQSNYKIKVGDTLKIFFGDNGSSSNDCYINLNKLHCLKYIGIEEHVKAKKYCDGCSTIKSHNFLAFYPGQDTIKYFTIFGMENCDSIKNRSSMNYFVLIDN